jgi:hypothetical protein
MGPCMLKTIVSMLLVSGFAAAFGAAAFATGSEHHHRGPRVKGYVERRGGYSYFAADSINTYGDARTRYGGASAYRDPMLDRQTVAGPFDHGFFFDSAIGLHGGDSPYMN